MTTATQEQAVDVQQREPQPVLSVRTTVPLERLPDVQADGLRAIWEHERGLRAAGPPFVRYHTFGDTEIDVEVGAPVADAVGDGRVVAGTLPGGTVISTLHIGPHDRLPEGYSRLVHHWIDADREPGPTTRPSPSSWRAESVQPVRQRDARTYQVTIEQS